MDGRDEWTVVPLQGLPFGAELRGVDLLAWDSTRSSEDEAGRRRASPPPRGRARRRGSEQLTRPLLERQGG